MGRKRQKIHRRVARIPFLTERVIDFREISSQLPFERKIDGAVRLMKFLITNDVTVPVMQQFRVRLKTEIHGGREVESDDEDGGEEKEFPSPGDCEVGKQE